MFIFFEFTSAFSKNRIWSTKVNTFSDLSNLISSIFQLLHGVFFSRIHFLNFLPIFAGICFLIALYRQSNPELEYELAHDL